MRGAEGWFICRVGFVETARAVALASGRAAAKKLREEWPAFGVIEVDQQLVEHASALAVEHELRSLGALHLAAALVLPRDELVMVTWDRRLRAGARAEGLGLLPISLD
jgi:uncharacterized protein